MPRLTANLRQHAAGIRVLLRETRRWSQAGDHSESRPFFGLDPMPARTDQLHGGAVKLLDLADHFSVDTVHPNLLYLVSSALPPYVGIMIRRARAAGAAIVLNQNGVAYPAWHGPGWERTNALLSLAHRSADAVIYQSRFCRVAAEQFLAPRRGRRDILYNPVDTKVFTPASSPLDGPLTLICAGSHHVDYRVLLSLDVLAALRDRAIDARLLIAGRFRWHADEAIGRRQVETHADRLRITDRITIVGAYTQAQAPDLMRRAHILLHPCYNDACPRLVVEAMACGLPVVYSASGGTPELVGADAGIGIPAPADWSRLHPPDANALCDAVVAVHAKLPDYAARARDRAVQQFALAPWIARHRQLFESLLTC